MTEVLLKELINSDINWIINQGHQQEIPAGTVLISADQATNYLYILLDGILKVTANQPDDNLLSRAFVLLEDRENSGQEITRLFSGEIVGDIPFVTTHSRGTTIQAVEKSLVISIPQEELERKLQQDIDFAGRFYRGDRHYPSR